MMRKSALILLLCFFTISMSYAQAKISKEALNYYQNVSNAIVAYYDSNFVESVSNYNLAFQNEGVGFVDDYHNCLKLSNEINDVETAYYCAFKLAEKNICLEYFEHIDILKNDADQWKILLNIINSYKKDLNVDFMFSIDSLHLIDQGVRSYYDEGLIEEERKKKDMIRDEADSLNYIRFQELINFHGFPSEAKIGRNCSFNSRGIWPPSYDLLLWHYILSKREGVNDLLIKGFEENCFDNLQFSRYSDYFYSKAYYDVAVFRIGDTLYVENFSDDFIKNMNLRRKDIGLMDVRLYIEIIKKQFSAKDQIGFKFQPEIRSLPKNLFPKEKLDEIFIPLMNTNYNFPQGY